MNANTLTIARPQADDAIIRAVLDAVDSEHTRRAYARALNDFLSWYAMSGARELNKPTVQRYAAELRARCQCIIGESKIIRDSQTRRRSR
jgi:site-specific recombinase XerD